MKKQNYDEYIVFILGTDNFDICKKIRDKAIEFGMDGLYEICIYLATKFEKYDKDKYNTWSQYESLRRFLKEYEKEINDYLNNEIGFDIKEDKQMNNINTQQNNFDWANKITLKDGSIIYIEKYNNSEEKGRHKIYDSNGKYIDYLDSENYPTEKEYNGFIEFAQNELIDAEKFFDYFCQSYDYGTTPQEILRTYIEDITAGELPIEFYTDEELCDIYDINKIGNLYFRGNW